MKGRHDIDDEAWEAIRDCIPEPCDTGRPPRDPRQVLNGVLWILRTGAPWRDLPECYGPWPTVYYRFRVWEREGVIDCILQRLQRCWKFVFPTCCERAILQKRKFR